jgi:hypothetical protein
MFYIFQPHKVSILLSVNLSNNDSNSNTVNKTNHSKTKIKSWENEKVTDFQKNIDEESSCRTTARDRTDFKRVVSPVMVNI